MAEIAVWLQLKNNKIRKISATSLTWVWGREVMMTTLKHKTTGTVLTLDTFVQRIENPADPTAATSPTTAPTLDFTVVQEQLAVSIASSVTPFTPTQLSPSARTTSTETTVFTASESVVRLKAPPELKKIIDVRVTDYIRFTGTELPAAGLIFVLDEIAGMFTTEPTAAQL